MGQPVRATSAPRRICADCPAPLGNDASSLRCRACAARLRAKEGRQGAQHSHGILRPVDGRPCPVDDIVAVLNPTRARDLEWILRMTPPRLRIDVALAFANLTRNVWAPYAGLDEVTVGRWINGGSRMPLGAGFRLARVLGIDAELLFEHYL